MIMRNKTLVQGVGINDADYPVRIYEEQGKIGGKRSRKLVWQCKFYQIWKGIIDRCFSDKIKQKQPTYKEVSIVEDWLYFSKFKAWMETQDWEGKFLDKDILIPGNKVYGPDVCVFVSRKTNNFVRTSEGSRGMWPLGVNLCKRTGKFVAMGRFYNTSKPKNLGCFTTPTEAHQAWLKFKLQQARVAAEAQVDGRVAKALIDLYTIHADRLV